MEILAHLQDKKKYLVGSPKHSFFIACKQKDGQVAQEDQHVQDWDWQYILGLNFNLCKENVKNQQATQELLNEHQSESLLNALFLASSYMHANNTEKEFNKSNVPPNNVIFNEVKPVNLLPHVAA